MKNLTKLSAIALAGSVMMTSAKAVEIEVGYAYSSLFDVTMERLIPEFNKAHPDITVKFRACLLYTSQSQRDQRGCRLASYA